MSPHSDASTSAGSCPFDFNFDPQTFKVGDLVSYRVSERFGDMPFVGRIVGVHDDHVLIVSDDEPDRPMRGTRTSRPDVPAHIALG